MQKAKFTVIPGVETDVLSCPSSIDPKNITDNAVGGRRDRELAEKVMQLYKQIWPVLHGRNRQRVNLDFLDLCICQWRYVLSRSKCRIITSKLPVPTISDMQSNS